jgi:hypothetical protein
MVKFLLSTLACLSYSCTASPSVDVTGTYQFVSPDFNNAVGKLLQQRLTFTPDKVIISMGATSTSGDYEVEDGFVYIVSGNARFGYKIISRDTLQYEGPLSLGPQQYVRMPN